VTRTRRLALLQWTGIFVAPAAWIAQHAIGQAAAQISCSTANLGWGISNDAWQIGLLVGAEVLIVASAAAAVALYRATSDSDYHSPPPVGRMQLFAIAAIVTNVLLFVIVMLDGIASVVDVACRQS
jgi:hypothetical protein